MHYILCKDDSWTDILKKEITAELTTKCFAVEGFPLIKITDDISLKNEFIAFSTTALINASLIPDNSISKQVNEAVEILNLQMSDTTKINLHVYTMTQKFGIIETGRADIVKEKVISALKKKKVSILRKGFDRTLPFLQILILPDRTIALSYITKEEVSLYHSLISPFVGGFSNVADDKKAPSRAFKKIVEAQEIMGKEISEGETIVDLGACPGGWTYIARNSGATVIALDRSALEDELMADEKVTFLKEDAFKFEVSEVVDWVISDIICTPERILELIDYWVVGENCKNFVFTIKFQGQSDYGILKKFKEITKKTQYKVILKQLNANKNEVTIMGARVN